MTEGFLLQAGATAKTPASGGRKSVRRFENGFAIEDVAIGQPDGKLAKVRTAMRPIRALYTSTLSLLSEYSACQSLATVYESFLLRPYSSCSFCGCAF